MISSRLPLSAFPISPFGFRLHLLVLFPGLFALPAVFARAADPAFDQWADGYAAQWVRMNPHVATRTQYFSGAEQDAIDRQLILADAWGSFYAARDAATQATLARRGLEELRRFSTAKLSPTQRTSAAAVAWTLNDAIANEEFAQHRFVFEQISGLHLELVNFLTATHPIRHARDAENYLVRLAQIGPRIDDGMAEARAAAARGIIPPRFVLQRVIDQLDGFVAGPPAENPLVASLDTRLAELGAGMTAEARARFVAAAEKEVRANVLPAYRRARDLLAAQLPQSNDDAGVWRLPHGEEAYARALASNTTTSLTAGQIHAIGLREVARIEKEMDAILRQLGFAVGSLEARVEQVNVTLQLPDEPDPRPILLARAQQVVRDAERRSAAVFDLRPKAPVTVKREPAFSEASAAAHCSSAAPDGSMPGIYWLPLADLGPKVTWLGVGLKSAAYHETIPGHHFQGSIQQESTELPRYRKMGIFGDNNAYIEGWALYAERLAEEYGWYEGDLPGRLGYLKLQLFRARRLVADTGLHAKHWTRQQTIGYGFTPTEAERYCVWPGQACSYMVGQLRILELRENAKTALGAKFSIKEFHNVVLRGGSLPLDVLAQEVAAWVAATQAK
jgi:uncharacterized protein (DUF885 family)